MSSVSSVRNRILAASGALALLAGGAVVATPSAPIVHDSGRIQLAQNINLTVPKLQVGQPFSLDLMASIKQLLAGTLYANATITISSIAGLPPGLTWNSGTNIISGTPTTAGTYTVTASAQGCASILILGQLCIPQTGSYDFTVDPASASGTPTAISTPTSTPTSSTTSPTPTSSTTPPTMSTTPTSSVPTGTSGSLDGGTGSLALGSLAAVSLAAAAIGTGLIPMPFTLPALPGIPTLY